ncbi:alpha-hydroxy-acid oxidizing protein [Pseudoalteromonas shioyasakiensis]|uniref:Alpha-hydroxy-acid oxidizing protein n=1 Tax=Pseudoalteromonas shioyasakiensis TaxID=1190813 RepID=A0ABT6TWC5_9GAMM|nr:MULTISPECIES: alpha-hydroxy acid oxidase [Pseudoalteromonas]MDI4668197.1 alpha-hydroxy-acid oxidizing protein [Pseudoalteromonas shioyasakiensis]MDI4672573.1 alpha-hydroxy-acid oxidizing protein [Pseudoalteromonas shioyasakiensis]MDI4684637.1 alpha-hydroxy-acid oxidizing protein [Pseudoalteromonas shioyasakiensis]MDI4703399.1 alpha-hydroxy-acid oxidizing protein [Pseudoalteromonas shioyasakiensis]NUJ19974.1 alpha-hydroxy-acid oxidizing protein [Pseudoalteromonas sp. 0802]
MSNYFNHLYPDVADLKKKAKQRIPRFAFDYLEGGCMQEHGVKRNRDDINSVQLRSELLKPFAGSSQTVELFGHTYAAPFGIAPVGLQGLMWPKAPEILAKAAAEKNIPYVLSTVSSSSLERIAEESEGHAWFQLYNPTDEKIRLDLLNRIKAAHYPVLVVTVDVPTFGYRPRDIRNGLAMPPKMTLSNILQMLARPRWLYETSLAGKPEMETLKPYMPKNMPTDELAAFMNKTVMGRVDLEGLKPIRDLWQGPLIIKGLINESDVQAAIALGADGVVMSNHGARQLDAGESPVKPLQTIAAKYSNDIKIFMDSGLRSGTNIVSALASGADFTFLGRPFVYGVGALGDRGGIHTINTLMMQITQIMNQLGCATVSELPDFLVK